MTDMAPSPSRPTDRQDERLREDAGGIRGALSATVGRIRGGDLGLLPVIIGLALIWTIFQILNPFFLSSNNLANLLMQSVPVGLLALGVVCVLLVGEIDLSVGSVSGLSAAIVAVTFVNLGWPLPLAILASVAVGLAVGAFYGVIYIRLGVPSFVITLAGLLGFLGLQLLTLGKSGTINLPVDSFLVYIGQQAFVPKPLAYALVVLAAVALFLGNFLKARRRTAAGLSSRPLGMNIAASGTLLVVLGFAAWFLNQSRGVGWMFVFFIALVLVMNLRADAHLMGPFHVRSRRQQGGGPAFGHQCLGRLYVGVHALLCLRSARWPDGGSAPELGGAADGDRRCKPQCDRGRSDRRHQFVRRAGLCIRCAHRRARDPVDLERAHAAQPRLVDPLHRHRSRCADRRGAGCCGTEVAQLERTRIAAQVRLIPR